MYDPLHRSWFHEYACVPVFNTLMVADGTVCPTSVRHRSQDGGGVDLAHDRRANLAQASR